MPRSPARNVGSSPHAAIALSRIGLSAPVRCAMSCWSANWSTSIRRAIRFMWCARCMPRCAASVGRSAATNSRVYCGKQVCEGQFVVANPSAPRQRPRLRASSPTWCKNASSQMPRTGYGSHTSRSCRSGPGLRKWRSSPTHSDARSSGGTSRLA